MAEFQDFPDLDSILAHLDEMVVDMNATNTPPTAPATTTTSDLLDDDLDAILNDLGRAFPSTSRTLIPIKPLNDDDVTKTEAEVKASPKLGRNLFSSLKRGSSTNDASKSNDKNTNDVAEKTAVESTPAQQRPENFVNFYNQDKSYRVLDLIEGQIARDICSRLIIKNMAVEDRNWFLVEYLPQYQLQRVIEDHEVVMDIYKQWQGNQDNKFYFTNDYKKYEVFYNPEQFFPDHMIDKDEKTGALSEDAEKAKLILLKRLFSQADKAPDIQSHLYVREGRRAGWKKVFCVLRGTRICYSTKGTSKDPRFLVTFSELADKNIYLSRTPFITFDSPNDYCICLKPEGSDTESKDLYCISSEDERTFKCWLVGLRLAKYGSVLRENFLIAKRRHKKIENLKRNFDVTGPYASEDWYHGKLSREDSHQRLKPFSEKNGAFLIRDSQSCFVLSFVRDGAPMHYKIPLKQFGDEHRYSMDNGETKFDDLIDLLAYYRLNLGNLPCLLTDSVPRPQTEKPDEQTDE